MNDLLSIKGFVSICNQICEVSEFRETGIDYQRGILEIMDKVNFLCTNALLGDKEEIKMCYKKIYSFAEGIIISSATNAAMKELFINGKVKSFIFDERENQIKKWGKDKHQPPEGYSLILKAKSAQLISRWMNNDNEGIRKYAIQIATLSIVALQELEYEASSNKEDGITYLQDVSVTGVSFCEDTLRIDISGTVVGEPKVIPVTFTCNMVDSNGQ